MSASSASSERALAPLVQEGYARAQAVTYAHAKSFSFASHLLFGARRRAAFALYAFCRRTDDLVDEQGLDVAPAERALDWVYGGRAAGHAPADWHSSELHALRDAVTRFDIPEQPFRELLLGMRMDEGRVRVQTWAQLDLYCHRAAGVVGLMLAPVLGFKDPAALGPAADLGRAMQLTNILRDVGEDLGRDRIYLPASELAAFGLSETDLRAGTVDGRWVAFMRHQIERARALYASALRGVPYLTGFGARRTVALMAAVYGDILRVIEARGYDVFRGRARVGTGRKLLLASRALVWPGAGSLARRARPSHSPEVPLLPPEVAR